MHGMNNSEKSNQYFLLVSEVKIHVNNIYDKTKFQAITEIFQNQNTLFITEIKVTT